MKSEQLNFIQFIPESVSEADVGDILALQVEAFKESNPNDPVPPEALLRQNLDMLSNHPLYNVKYYLVKNSEHKPVARLMMLFGKPDTEDYEAQKHMCLINLTVASAHRRQGIGTEILKFVVKELEGTGVTLLQTDTGFDSGRAFSNHFGAEIAIESRDSRVNVADLNWEMLEKWNEEGEKSNPDVRIDLFAGLPDDKDIEAYSRLYTEVFNQQPFDDIEGLEVSWTPDKLREIHARMAEMGSTDYVMITREANGDISGLTELAYNPERSHRMGQGLTGVQESYRGRGLGKWLKAKMLFYMRDNFPDVEHVATTNASSNEAMLSINDRLGFKLYKHNTAYKIPVSELAKKLCE
ncbi:MAG: hypothetical protein Phog2KO_24130 [Phototrophicaceae bacterium]